MAMAVFVLHNGAMAGLRAHGMDHAPGGGHAAMAEELRQHQECGGETAHIEAEGGCVNSSDSHDHEGAQGLHTPPCGSVCGFALPSLDLGPATVRIAAPIIQVPVSQQGSGIDPDGLKRPPRTSCIA